MPFFSRFSLSPEICDELGDSLSIPVLYQQALQELELTYGHPQIVSRTYMQSLIQLPRINNNDHINPRYKAGGGEKLLRKTLRVLPFNTLPTDWNNSSKARWWLSTVKCTWHRFRQLRIKWAQNMAGSQIIVSQSQFYANGQRCGPRSRRQRRGSW